jgi:hypothetical protein
LDVSGLLEDAEVAVAPGTTSLPRHAEPEPQPDTIFDVEVVEEGGGGGTATPPQEPPQDLSVQPFMDAGARSPSRPSKDASETFMVPQESLEEQMDLQPADMEASDGLDSLDDDSLSVDGTDMSDVSDLLDDLDEE